jgi:hypothetical protein
MDTLIVFLLLVIAVALFTKRPIQIHVHHKHESVTPPLVEDALPDPPEDVQPLNLDSVIHALNEVMGVSTYGEEDREE